MAHAHGGVLPRGRPRDDVEAGRDNQVETGREAVLMQTTFKVHRYDPEAGGKPTSQAYALDLPEEATVLDGLFKIRDELDGTLAFRASCNWVHSPQNPRLHDARKASVLSSSSL